jgi:hypothetical protein
MIVSTHFQAAYKFHPQTFFLRQRTQKQKANALFKKSFELIKLLLMTAREKRVEKTENNNHLIIFHRVKKKPSLYLTRVRERKLKLKFLRALIFIDFICHTHFMCD